jgi:hypothetical protein
LKTTYEGPGTDQLGVVLGDSMVGDVCQLHFVGNITSTPKSSCCVPGGTEFIDSMHMQTRVNVTIKEFGVKEYEGLYRGLNEALKMMKFGEESTFFIPSELAFGPEGLSKSNAHSNLADNEARNPGGTSFIPIGPDEDLVLDIVFFRVGRDGQWHNRTIKNKNGLLNGSYSATM